MVLLLLDFDGTITQHDTLASLIALAIAESSSGSSGGSTSHQSNSTSATLDPPNAKDTTTTAPDPHDSQNRKVTLEKLWDDIVQDYVASHKRHTSAYNPSADQRTTLQEELEFLESVRHVELHSVGRVSEAGFFRGLGRGVLEGLGRRAVEIGLGCSAEESTGGEDPKGEGGEGEGKARGQGEELIDGGNGEKDSDGNEGEQKEGAVVVRKGFGEFVEQQAGRGWDVGIVSVNWCGEFIRGVVEGRCEPGQGQRKVRRVIANGIGFPDGRVQGPAELGGEPLVSAGDKLRAMRSLRRGWEEEKVVYFGDSTTDLACLVEADFGVVIADDRESKLLRTLKRVGLDVSHVGEAKEGSKLVWARDFLEVLQSGVMERI
jgi:2-hydroxy-3-keto-5-methylthiopentenyl-1-phosphate phosphatase